MFKKHNMRKITIALDWSPNTLHAGFFVAYYNNWYADAGIQITFHNPEEDNYQRTPAKMIANGLAHFGIAPTESILSYRTLPSPVPLVALATLLQKDLSAIVTLKSSEIASPKNLDGKNYASFGARFEDCIVKKMIQNDGGFGMLRITNPNKLGIWDCLLTKKADACWVFLPWEGMLAKQAKIELNTFQMSDFGIPYGYSPLLISHQNLLEEYPQTVADFVTISQLGFQFAAQNPEKTAELLCNKIDHSNFTNESFILESLRLIAKNNIHTSGKWGKMDEQVWVNFIDWLSKNNVLCDIDGSYLQCIQHHLPAMFNNDFLST